MWAELMAEYTKKSKEFWILAGGNKNLYLNPQECLQYGLIDEVF